jgi:ATP adenylyltransferase
MAFRPLIPLLFLPGGVYEPARMLPRSDWQPLIDARVAEALACGALEPIQTGVESVQDGAASFELRWVESLARKPTPATLAAKNPFLPPYEAPLVLGEVRATHVCLLNKFPVFPGHLLLITREFEPQEADLTLADLEALYRARDALPGLGFYNGGTTAGASQPHKHLQWVPHYDAPLEPLWMSGTLPFRHAAAPTPEHAAAGFAELTRLRHTVGLSPGRPWNLLLTRRSMLVVPRSRERVEGLGLNGLAYAGSLFGKTPAALEPWRRRGLLGVLREAGEPVP